ncbi:MAG: type II toxin-antitoxin system HicB family antitoxin [Pirellulales bacterium]
MRLTVELIPDEEQGGFTATVPDIPAYGEGETEAAAIEDLKEALRLYIEVRGIDAAMSLVCPRAVVRQLDLDLTKLVRD